MLSTPDTQKLAKLLGMLGSAHDGEALTAARKAHQLVKQHGTTWFDVISAPDPARDTAPHIAHHAIALELMRHSADLTEYENNFLRGILTFQKLSDKQAGILETIKVKVAAFSEAG